MQLHPETVGHFLEKVLQFPEKVTHFLEKVLQETAPQKEALFPEKVGLFLENVLLFLGNVLHFLGVALLFSRQRPAVRRSCSTYCRVKLRCLKLDPGQLSKISKCSRNVTLQILLSGPSRRPANLPNSSGYLTNFNRTYN